MEIIGENKTFYLVNINNEDELKLVASMFLEYQCDYLNVDDYFKYLNSGKFSNPYHINKSRKSELMSILRELKLKRILE